MQPTSCTCLTANTPFAPWQLGSGGGGGPRVVVSDNRDYRRELDGAMTGLGIADDAGGDDLLDLMDNA
eukprot:213747-Chlamydomonas_euryale.AAC.4